MNHKKHNVTNQIKLKTSLIRSNLCDHSDFTPVTDCISEINNTEIDNTKGIDVVMLMYNLIEYSDHYLKTSGRLW